MSFSINNLDNIDNIDSHLSENEKIDILNQIIKSGNNSVSNMESLRESLANTENRHSDPLDNADEITFREQVLREVDREKSNINTIKAIIDNINATGEYGYCLNPTCGEEIPLARLKAYPLSTLCIHCKTVEEEQQKHQPNFQLSVLIKN